MTLLNAASLILIMVTLAATPSASVALVVARSATLGISNGIAVSAGIVLGDLVFIALAILGMSVIAETMGAFFVVVRYLGAAYLIWMGFSFLMSESTAIDAIDRTKLQGSVPASFLSGFLLTLGDVKAIFFYASLLPTFVNLASVSNTDLLLIVSITVVTVGGVKVAYAIAASRFAAMGRNLKVQSGTKKLAGCSMIAAGGFLIGKA